MRDLENRERAEVWHDTTLHKEFDSNSVLGMVTVDYRRSRVGLAWNERAWNWFLNDDISRPGKRTWFLVESRATFVHTRHYITDGHSFYQVEAYEAATKLGPKAFWLGSYNNTLCWWKVKHWSSNLRGADARAIKRKIKKWVEQCAS